MMPLNPDWFLRYSLRPIIRMDHSQNNEHVALRHALTDSRLAATED